MDFVNLNDFIALVTLASLEIVLGIDNIIFISILVGRLPEDMQKKGRILGLSLALVTRILFLFSITLLMKFTKPLFSIFAREISGRDLILIAGGLFLLAKSTLEIHNKLEGKEEEESRKALLSSFWMIIFQIALIDIVFSLDSVITAIGMVNKLWIMVLAVIIAIFFMMAFSGYVSDFVERHPTIKILALSFLLLVGFALVGDGLKFHIPRGYIYFAMGFSVFVEMINLKIRGKESQPVHLKKPSI
ncbi:MAG: TerC family protein [bacterium]